MTFKNGNGTELYLCCAHRLKCKVPLSVDFDKDNQMIFLNYMNNRTQGLTSCKIVELAKANFAKHLELGGWSLVYIPEDDRFTLTTNFTRDWKNLQSQLIKYQSNEVRSDALDSINEAYGRVIDVKDITHSLTIPQFVQLITVFSSLLRMNADAQHAYISCHPKLK
ncbi:unnamed protein product [Ambrosiozyma monospora]|uniref:Unnamed protein product n=1 Tax=Ambrosiozyma monospora TaxID=43982 RepID=A0ACB5U1P4_AMBMO|nr:unnamed protein product [Ambrosiozyma monospora]